MEQKSNRREFVHTKELSGDGRASEPLTLAEIRKLILSTTLTWPAAIPLFRWHGYAHVSLLCFPLVMLFDSHWLLAQAPFCGVHICHHHRIQPCPSNLTTSTGPQISSGGCTCFNIHRYTAPVGMVTFRQSPCWYYYLWPDAAVSTSNDTQTLWAWWHSGDHTDLINLCLQHPLYSHLQVTLIYYRNYLVDWGCRIRRLHLFRGVRLLYNENDI